MPLSVIYQPIRSELQATEALLRKELSQRDGLLGEMTRYVATMPGKRIRPALALLSAGIAKGAMSSPRKRGSDSRFRENDGMPGVPDPQVRLAVAVEMIHTATLLHDDVIDGASLRRGLSTLNSKWGDTLSVLSGDYLYSKAFCLLSELNHPAVLSLMSETARIVCEGEVAQIQHQFNLSLSREAYLKIIQRKTASLMGAAAQAGALLAGAARQEAARLGAFGLNFGLAFQIMDDAHDLLGSEEAIGKSLGSDLGSGQMTLPILYLRDSAGPKVKELLSHWFADGNGHHAVIVSPEQSRGRSSLALQEKVDLLALLKQETIRSDVTAHCRQAADRYLNKARGALAPFPVSPCKESLLTLAEQITHPQLFHKRES